MAPDRIAGRDPPPDLIEILSTPGPGRVLITGGAGFLGRRLAAAMARSGWRVCVLDDLSCPGSTFDSAGLRHEFIRCVHGSVVDARLIRSLVPDQDVVVHFASVVGVQETMARPVDTTRNVRGTLSLVEVLSADQVLVFGSSADVYGMHCKYYGRPMREDDDVVFEHAGVNRWTYPKVKSLEENLVLQSAASSAIIRIFNSYGPGMDARYPRRVIPWFVRSITQGEPVKISGSGEQRRTFCYWTDTLNGIALALVAALDHGRGYRETFNIGHSRSVSILHLAQLMMEQAIDLGILHSPLPIERDTKDLYTHVFDDTWDREPDISRAQRSLGFQPQVDLDRGLRATLALSQRAGRAAEDTSWSATS